MYRRDRYARTANTREVFRRVRGCQLAFLKGRVAIPVAKKADIERIAQFQASARRASVLSHTWVSIRAALLWLVS